MVDWYLKNYMIWQKKKNVLKKQDIKRKKANLDHLKITVNIITTKNITTTKNTAKNITDHIAVAQTIWGLM